MKFNTSSYFLKGMFAVGLFICIAIHALAQTFHVSGKSGDDSNDGSTWERAKQTIQAAINAAPSGSRIFIQAGEYRFQNIVIPSSRNVEIYGGFLGFEKSPSERPELPEIENREMFKYQTSINGFSDGGAKTQRHGLYVREPGNIVIDRLTICGWANPNNMQQEYGAGIFAVSRGFQKSEFIVKDCTITDNDARFLSGFSGGDGGGMYFSGHSIRIGIYDNLIARNFSRSCGAGICVYSASGIIAGNYGRDNADEEFGGFAYFSDCEEIDFIGNTVVNNKVQFPAEGGAPSGPGGGIIGIESSLRILGNRIIGNVAAEGGGLFFVSGEVIVEWNLISSNEAIGGVGGGAIAAFPSRLDYLNLTVNHNIIEDNFSDYLGGGIYLSSAILGSIDAYILNNLMTHNTALVEGGACKMESINRLTMTSNTLYGNQAALSGGIDINVFGSRDNLNFFNNIIAFNQGIGFSSAYDLSESMSFYNNNIYGNSQNYQGTRDRTGIDGNLSEDPLFLDANNRNLRLGAASPCIDSGTNKAFGLPLTDLDGLSRSVGSSPDIGAYEKQE